MSQDKDTRYIVETEPTPEPRPRWWRSRYGVVDTWASNLAVIHWFWAWGAADRRARCLNRGNWLDCQSSSPAESHVEQWSLSA